MTNCIECPHTYYVSATSIVDATHFYVQVEFSNGLPSEEFDTLLYAAGRRPDTRLLNLEAAGVQLDHMGKIIATQEQTSVPNIFVVGDALSKGSAIAHLFLHGVFLRRISCWCSALN